MAKIIRVEQLTSQKGNKFEILWFEHSSGIPVKVFEFRSDRLGVFKEGMSADLEIIPDSQLRASVRVK